MEGDMTNAWAKPLQLQQLHEESVHLKNHQHFDTTKLFFSKRFLLLMVPVTYKIPHEYFTNQL